MKEGEEEEERNSKRESKGEVEHIDL